MADPTAQLAQRLGVVGSYTDQLGRRHRTSKASQRALLHALGVTTGSDREATDHLARLEAEDLARVLPPYVIAAPDAPPRLALPQDADWVLTREDGSTHQGRGPGNLPAVPLGLHRLALGPHRTTLIVAPPCLPLPPRGWGVMLPLHAVREVGRDGIGTYADLTEAGMGLGARGAGFLGLNPIHAGFFADPGSFSPYSPSHRRRLSPFHIAVPEAVGAGDPVIDYAREIPARRAALAAAFAAFNTAGDDPEFHSYRRSEGAALERFALHQALSDLHGAYWTDWPAALRDPDSAACAQARNTLQDEITFHAWAQWRAASDLGRANRAMREAGMAHGLYLDLAVGTHPAGAETWEDRRSFAFDASLGAPPDAFSADGQAWGLAPFNPRALIEDGFGALAETLRCQLAHAGLLRIDHILGFDRAFWVPADPNARGAYVRMPRDAMLAVARLEAARAGATLIGEDLGNLPRGLRKALRASGILGCRVQMFERSWTGPVRYRAPESFEPVAIASFSTHDLPTWAGWREAHDIETRRDLGHITEDYARSETAQRKEDVTAFDAMTAPCRPAGSDPANNAAMHHALAASTSALAMVQIENVLDMNAQPNLPGTVSEYPNWRQRLPLAPRALANDPRMRLTAEIMGAQAR